MNAICPKCGEWKGNYDCNRCDPPIEIAFPAANSYIRHRFEFPVEQLRDWFAGQALAGFLANSKIAGLSDATVVSACWKAADAMLAARDKKADNE